MQKWLDTFFACIRPYHQSNGLGGEDSRVFLHVTRSRRGVCPQYHHQCKRAIFNYFNSCVIQIIYLYLGLKRGNIGEALVSLIKMFTSSSVGFRSLGGLKIFGEKSLGKCTMYIGTAVMPKLC